MSSTVASLYAVDDALRTRGIIAVSVITVRGSHLPHESGELVDGGRGVRRDRHRADGGESEPAEHVRRSRPGRDDHQVAVPQPGLPQPIREPGDLSAGAPRTSACRHRCAARCRPGRVTAAFASSPGIVSVTLVAMEQVSAVAWLGGRGPAVDRGSSTTFARNLHKNAAS